MGIVLGWVGKAVDGLGRRCTLERFVWADGDLDALGSRRVWDDNDLRSEINSAKVSSLIHGPAFLVNTSGDDDEPESLVHVRDAANATARGSRVRLNRLGTSSRSRARYCPIDPEP